MHEQEGKEYDAADWIDPATVADAILHVLDLPGDATISDLTLVRFLGGRARAGPARG